MDTITIKKAVVISNELFGHNYESGDLVTILQKHGDGWVCADEGDMLQFVHHLNLLFKPDEYLECDVDKNGVVDFDLPSEDNNYYLGVDGRGRPAVRRY